MGDGGSEFILWWGAVDDKPPVRVGRGHGGEACMNAFEECAVFALEAIELALFQALEQCVERNVDEYNEVGPVACNGPIVESLQFIDVEQAAIALIRE